MAKYFARSGRRRDDRWCLPGYCSLDASPAELAVLQSDRECFADNATREFRVRHPFIAELPSGHALTPGHPVRIVVRKLHEEVRVRVSVVVRPGERSDRESDGRRLWQRGAQGSRFADERRVRLLARTIADIIERADRTQPEGGAA